MKIPILWNACLDAKRIVCCMGSVTEGHTPTCPAPRRNANGKEFKLSYPCCVLNCMVAEHNTNDQYQELVAEDPSTEGSEVRGTSS